MLFHIFVESKGYLEKRHRRSWRIKINDNTEVVIVWAWLFLTIERTTNDVRVGQ